MASSDQGSQRDTGFSPLELGLRAGFIDASLDCPEDARPRLVHNSVEAGGNLLAIIKQQLSMCESFDFCVAFVADSGLQPLVDVLVDLKRRGVRGRFLTSTYLNFNSPSAFRKLLEYENIEVRVYQGDLHAKGYLFEHDATSTVIVGSANLTQSALTCNREWNVLFRSYDRGGMLVALQHEFDALWNDPTTSLLTPEWIEGYERYRASHAPRTSRRPAFRFDEVADLEYRSTDGVTPNAMQRHALEALDVIHRRGEDRALLVSATGTGKTYLSAFDVRGVKPARVLFLVHRRRILTASLKSFRRVLGDQYTYGMYDPAATGKSPTCLFAMCSTIVNHLGSFDPAEFDYIVIDEAHRVGSRTYQQITSYFTPRFMLGMTATPNRTNNDYDVFALFHYVIAYQITLQDALANDMLAPFHYFGIADLAIDYEKTDDVQLFARLTSGERVRHITEKIEEYTVDKSHRRGLVFCSRNSEAEELSRRFNELGYRTRAVSGATGDAGRDEAIAQLESGELEYLFSVDIFNEGIDIPSVNQVIMLRQTESAIVFVQQLGRGLRKFDGKEYTLVLDFIGNYQKNFFVPVALSGDRTYNKDNLRRVVQNGSSVIPGCSTVSFDKVSEARIYRAIDGGKFTAQQFLKGEYENLRRMLGHVPALDDFDANGAIDPLLIFGKYGSYHAFLCKVEKGYKDEIVFSKEQCAVLEFISRKLAAGKRAEELELLKALVEGLKLDELALSEPARSAAWRSAARVLTGAFAAPKEFVPMLSLDGSWRLSNAFVRCLKDPEFKRQVLEVVDFGLRRYRERYAQPYKGTALVLNEKYTYEEACRLLGWEKNVNGQNIGGYKYDDATNTFPVFINYDKDPSISDSIKYEDRFISESELVAISKQPRYLTSPEIKNLRHWPGNGMKIYLFMRKNKNDGDSKEFYFLGGMEPTGSFKPITMPGANKEAVEITYRLNVPVRSDLYAFLTADLGEGE